MAEPCKLDHCMTAIRTIAAEVDVSFICDQYRTLEFGAFTCKLLQVMFNPSSKFVRFQDYMCRVWWRISFPRDFGGFLSQDRNAATIGETHVLSIPYVTHISVLLLK